MDITPLIPKGRQIIEAYGDGGFRVSGQRYEGPLLVLPHHCIAWVVGSEDRFSIGAFAQIMTLRAEVKIDLLLLGTGAALHPIAKATRQELMQQGLAIESMDTGAACRTYNVLLAEGRDICAALLPV